MELVGNCHGTREVLLVRQFQITSWMPSYYVQRSGQNCGIVLAEIKRIYIAPTVLIMWFSFLPVPGTSPSLSRNFRETGWRIGSTKIGLCNCQELVPNLLAISLLYSHLIAGLRHEVPNLQSIIFSLSIAISWLPGEAQSAELAIQTLYSIWLPRMRHKVPN